MQLRDDIYLHIAQESEILDRLRKQLPPEATIEEKCAMRDRAAQLAADALRRRVGVPKADRVLNEISLPVAKMRSTDANRGTRKPTSTPRKRSRKQRD